MNQFAGLKEPEYLPTIEGQIALGHILINNHHPAVLPEAVKDEGAIQRINISYRNIAWSNDATNSLLTNNRNRQVSLLKHFQIVIPFPMAAVPAGLRAAKFLISSFMIRTRKHFDTQFLATCAPVPNVSAVGHVELAH